MLKKMTIIALSTIFAVPTLSGAVTLPDTGQTKCYQTVSPWAEILCEGTGQDGAYDINPMSFTDNGDGTVTDDNTGLMWQQEDDNQLYNWYQASGTYHDTLNSSTQDVCGSLQLGGHEDWRLPGEKELVNLVDYGVPTPGPTINSTYFPNTNNENYWSSTSQASNNGGAWRVDFENAVAGSGSKEFNSYVRCVRGEQSAQSLTDNGDGTVTDSSNGLVWQKGEPGLMTLANAFSYCEGLDLGNASDWRLPNAKEFESLTDPTSYYPAINTSYFPDTPQTLYPIYWSSTSYEATPYSIWTINFFHGDLTYSYKGGSYRVKCVRGGSSGPVLGDLSLTITGTGSGTVTGDGMREGSPATFSSDSSTTQQFDVGSSLTLTAVRREYSLFTGWTGDCSGGDVECVITMGETSQATAVFDMDTAHKTLVGVSNYYATLQEAYDNAPDSGVIKAWATGFIESLNCNVAKDVTIDGGYNEGYSEADGYTTLQGVLTIHRGSLVAENLAVM